MLIQWVLKTHIVVSVQFSVQSFRCFQLFATPWIAACQASLSITNSQSSLKLTSIESVMSSSYLILCRPLLLLPPIPPSIRVLSYMKISVQSLARIWVFAIPWTAACQVSLSISNSQGLVKLMLTESVMPSNHLILCHPILLLPSNFPSIRVFPNESALHIR